MKKADIKILSEKSQQYGLTALSDRELINMLGFDGHTDEFWNSHQFKAMKEAVRRKEAPELKKITSSKDAYEILSFLEGLDHEQFWCLYLNRANKVIKTEFISKGGVSGTVVDVRSILSTGILTKCSAIVLSHNHPSGNLRPSQEDIKITQRIKDAAKLMDISVIDHVIIGNGEFFSFADDGIL